ncbi:MAG: hypothetical protein O2816_11165 [Planctomycetota bacterium]|nr:hypothetical protein [Planctomycetota bacterium]
MGWLRWLPFGLGVVAIHGIVIWAVAGGAHPLILVCLTATAVGILLPGLIPLLAPIDDESSSRRRWGPTVTRPRPCSSARTDC